MEKVNRDILEKEAQHRLADWIDMLVEESVKSRMRIGELEDIVKYHIETVT